jgi:transposase
MAIDKKGAFEQQATLIFIDESGFTERPPVRRTWAPRGMTPVIRYHFNWDKLNAIGAIACKPNGQDTRLLLHLQEESVTAQSSVDFLERLHQDIAGMVVVLWDGLPAHRSKLVKEYIVNNRHWLQLERFPAYAPELDPVEYLWAAVKGKDVANFCADTLGQIGDKLRQAADRVQNTDGMLYHFLVAAKLYGK